MTLPTILDSIVPVFFAVFLGTVLKNFRFIDDSFVGTCDKLVYYIFFPTLLFWKIGKPAQSKELHWDIIIAVMAAVFVAFVISVVYSRLRRFDNFEVGSFTQSCYRFSTYVGMAVVFSGLGQKGVREFGILIGFIIPFINVLAVSSLVWYSGRSFSTSYRIKIFFREIITNPLIISCAAGMLYSGLGIPMPGVLDRVFELISLMAMPLALISIGATLSISKIGGFLGKSLEAALIKLVVLPIIGFVFLTLLSVKGNSMQLAMIYFALPTSPSNFILSSQLNSDLNLAAAALVVSTLLSMLSLSAVLFIFSNH